MKWQPMPATALEPSGTRVEVLCGHPEQKYAWRTATAQQGNCGIAGDGFGNVELFQCLHAFKRWSADNPYTACQDHVGVIHVRLAL